MAKPGDVLENPFTGQTLTFRRTTAETGGELLEVESSWAAARARSLRSTTTRTRRSTSRCSRASCARGSETWSTRVRAGETLDVPAGTPHAMWNPGPGRARAVWQTRPALKTEAFFEMVWGLAQAARRRRRTVPEPGRGGGDDARVRRRVPPRAARLRNELAATPARRARGARAGPGRAARRRPALRRLGGGARLRQRRRRARLAPAPRGGRARGRDHLGPAAGPLRPRRHRAARAAGRWSEAEEFLSGLDLDWTASGEGSSAARPSSDDPRPAGAGRSSL